MAHRTTRTAALAIAWLAVGIYGASAQSDGGGGVSGGSATGGVGWTPSKPDGGATHGADKQNSDPSADGSKSPHGPYASKNPNPPEQSQGASDERKTPR